MVKNQFLSYVMIHVAVISVGVVLGWHVSSLVHIGMWCQCVYVCIHTYTVAKEQCAVDM